MIFIRDDLVKYLKLRTRWILAFFSILLLLIIVYAEFESYRNSINVSNRLADLDKKITLNLLDSIAVGLQQFYILKGHYPSTEGKYFFDSIKQYIDIEDVYVYSDSVDSRGKLTVIKKLVGKNFDYKKRHNTFIGISTPELIVTYKRLDSSAFILYSVGENLIDENGQGDDILYDR